MQTRFGKGKQALSVSLSEEGTQSSKIENIAIEKLSPGLYQPRKVFLKEHLDNIALSISNFGIEQPIVVRQLSEGYEIISGERRWRGAQLAGLTVVPVIIRSQSDKKAALSSVIENTNRVDLSSIELGYSFKCLKDEFNYTDLDIANATGRSRPDVSNHLRLLKLTPEAQNALLQSKIDMGHARALLSLKEPQAQVEALKCVISKKLTVRGTENYVRTILVGNQQEENRSELNKQLSIDLSKKIGLKVKVRTGSDGRPSLTIKFNSYEELDTQKISITKNVDNSKSD